MVCLLNLLTYLLDTHHTTRNHHQGECKFTITDEGHSEWVSCVRFSPSPTAPVIVSCGWDKKVKVRSSTSGWPFD